MAKDTPYFHDLQIVERFTEDIQTYHVFFDKSTIFGKKC